MRVCLEPVNSTFVACDVRALTRGAHVLARIVFEKTAKGAE